MIRETELNLFVPSPELLIRLASGDRPSGIRAGPPRIKSIRETFFDTPDQSLRRRGMTCKLRQVQGEEPSVVVTVGEGPDSEGITSRSRLTAAAVGAGVFETLRGDSEPATQIQKFVDPMRLRPQIALDIQRLGRVFRGGFLLKPVLLLFFDRVTVEVGGTSSVFHEISLRRRREGGPLIRDIARQLRDDHHLFPDGLSTLQRAYRVLAVEGKTTDQGVSPYGLSVALALFHDGKLGLMEKGDECHIPTFRGSGEDAARALSSDLMGRAELPLRRLGTTEPREGRAVAELWTVPDSSLSTEDLGKTRGLAWYPWNDILEKVGEPKLQDPTLIASLLLLTRRKLLGQLPWLDTSLEVGTDGSGTALSSLDPEDPDHLPPELRRIGDLHPVLRTVEDSGEELGLRLAAVSQLARALSHIFLQDVTRTKGKILSGVAGENEEAPTHLVDLLSIRVRGIVDRLYRCLNGEFIPALERKGIHLRTWSGIMHADRRALLDLISHQLADSLQVAPEWGPSFIPDMPPAGCAIGLMARSPGMVSTRFFHMVLRKDPPSFLSVPGSATVLPLEEVVRGYFLHQLPELEQAETSMFRFTTGSARVRTLTPRLEPPTGVESTEQTGEVVPLQTEPGPSPAPPTVETRESVVVRVMVHRKMPESYQAQLVRALERQVTRRNPLIGWSDLYPVAGPLDLTGLEELLDLKKRVAWETEGNRFFGPQARPVVCPIWKGPPQGKQR